MRMYGSRTGFHDTSNIKGENSSHVLTAANMITEQAKEAKRTLTSIPQQPLNDVPALVIGEDTSP
eukprot:scaffold6024_cov36-Attheya_sp.AAC.1